MRSLYFFIALLLSGPLPGFSGSTPVLGQSWTLPTTGNSVTLLEDQIVSGVQLYRRDESSWRRVHVFRGSLGTRDQLGFSSALSDSVAVLGAPANETHGYASGAVTVFERVDLGWRERQVLFASDAEIGDRFGNSVALNDSLLAIGAHHEDTFASRSGA